MTVHALLVSSLLVVLAASDLAEPPTSYPADFADRADLHTPGRVTAEVGPTGTFSCLIRAGRR